MRTDQSQLNKYFSMVISGLSMLLLFLAGLTSVLKITIPSLTFGFSLVPVFITLTVCLHYTAQDDKKLFSMLGVVFACMYGVFISFNYYLQLTLIQTKAVDLALFDMSNPVSMMWVIEILGYFFMGLSTVFISFIFGTSIVEKLIKAIFLFNGLLGIGGLIGYALRWDLGVMLWGLVLWNIVMPIAGALLIFYFKSYSIVNKHLPQNM
jgi:hypothetical protein